MLVMLRLEYVLLILIFPLFSFATDTNVWHKMSNGQHSLRAMSRQGSQFIVNVPVKHVEGARLVLFNHRLAKELGLELPEDPKELEALILKHFAFVIAEYLEPGGREWFATYYQDTTSKEKGVPRGDGRALWSGELAVQRGEGSSSIDVVLKGVGKTSLSATVHRDPSKIDGYQSMREAIHSYIMSEANSLNQLNTTMDLAVIEIPLTKKDHNGRVEKAAITIRLGEQTRVAHLRFWSDDPVNFQKIFDFTVRRTLGLSRDATVDANTREKYFNVFAKNLALEAARYYDLHAVHGSPTAGNRTASGATIDLGTFRYLDAHHSDYSFLFDKLKLGGEDGQNRVMRRYLKHVAKYATLAQMPLDLERALATFDAEFKSELTTLWLNRLGLDESMQKTLSPSTRNQFYDVFKKIHETSARNMVQFGGKHMAPAGFEPRRVFAKALSILQAPVSQRFDLAVYALTTDRSWSQIPVPSRGIIQSWLNGNKDHELTKVQNEIANELTQLLGRMRNEIPYFNSKLPDAIARAKAINGNSRLELGKELGQEIAEPILSAIQSGNETYVQISQRAMNAAATYVDPGLKFNSETNLGKKRSSADFCADMFGRGA